MKDKQNVRWMVSFWHPNGSRNDEPDFPKVDFWHPDRESSRAAAARVLVELREKRGDQREWVAAGHPDPFEVRVGRHTGGQWTLRCGDLLPPDASSEQSAAQRLRTMQSAAGAWKDSPFAADLAREIYEARRSGSREAPVP